jgi:hypothetical protein
MAEIKITVNGNPQKHLDKLGFVGDFARTTQDFEEIRTVTELRTLFGNSGGIDQLEAEALLNENIPLLVKGITADKDEFSFIPLATTSVGETLDGNFTQMITVEAASATREDGLSNLVTEDVTTTTSDAIEYTLVGGITISQPYSQPLQGFVQFNLAAAATPPGSMLGQTVEFKSVGYMDFSGLNGVSLVITDVNTSNSTNTVYKARLADQTVSFSSLVQATLPYTGYIPSSNTTGKMVVPSQARCNINITGGASLAPKLRAGDNIDIIDSAIAANNVTGVIAAITVSSGDIVIAVRTVNITTADTNSSSSTKVVFRDRSVINTITLAGNYTPIFNTVLNSVAVRGSFNANPAVLTDLVSMTLVSGDTVLTFTSLFPSGSTILLELPVTDLGNTVLTSASGLVTFTVLTGGQYGFKDSTNPIFVDVANLVDIIVLDDYTLYVLDAFLPHVDTITDTSIVGITESVSTKVKGQNSDLSVTINATNSGHNVTVSSQSILSSGERLVLEKWILPYNFDLQDIEDMNGALKLVSINIKETTGMPDYYYTAFTGANNTATQAERITTISHFDNVPIPAMYGKLGVPSSTYDFKFPKTIFIGIPNEYSLVQAITLGRSYNYSESRNIHLSYGEFNSKPLSFFAIKAFFETNLSGEAFTQVKYGLLGFAKSHLNNTVLTELQLKDCDEVGIMSMFSLNGSFSEYKLTNNTSPYRRKPLDRVSTNIILNRLIWEVHNIEFVNSDKPLNFDLFGTINLQFVQLLNNYSQYFSVANILDDSGAADLDSLKYNKKSDVLAGSYNVILELQFFNTLKKLRVEFVVS